MGPAWDPSGSCRPRWAPLWPHGPCYHGANIGPIWVLSAPGGPNDGHMNLAIWGPWPLTFHLWRILYRRVCHCHIDVMRWDRYHAEHLLSIINCMVSISFANNVNLHDLFQERVYMGTKSLFVPYFNICSVKAFKWISWPFHQLKQYLCGINKMG